ncbi:MAG TPA: chemotaxis protein CheW [bacterium]|nr:chemotaxis protein CheW [bacterium]HPI75272.1 chemotaxis protein CheW [bacterium]HPN93460.1 chemotaxis protein CheW [bacterium]
MAIATVESQIQKLSKYLTFTLGGEEYGLEILKVREIIGLMEITNVPRMPDFVRGVINLRGKVIPVVDLRLKFGMSKQDDTDETCIIVVDLEEMQMGVVVDHVSEVLDIKEGDIEETPSFGVQINTEFILGIGKAKDKVIILLDIKKVLTDSEIVKLSEAVK